MKYILIKQGERLTFMKFPDEDEKKVKEFYYDNIVAEGKDLQECVNNFQKHLDLINTKIS